MLANQVHRLFKTPSLRSDSIGVILGMHDKLKTKSRGFKWPPILVFLLILNKLEAQTATVAFQHGGLNRTAQVYVPPGSQPSDSLPLVLVLHGFTQSGTTMLNSAGFNALAQQYRAVIAYPNGVNAGWNTQSGMPGASTADDVGYLLTLADSIRARWGTRYHRLYSCGFSAGGFMSYRLACERPDRFEAVASVAGTMSTTAFAACQGPSLPPSFHVRLLHIHGTSDGVVSYAGGNGNVSAEQCVQSWVSRAQCPSQPVVQALPNTNTADGSTVEEFRYAPCAPLGPVGTTGAGRPGQVVFMKVTGGGHTWPGNTAPLFGLGNVNRDFQATARIMDFFLGSGATATNPELPNLPEKNPTWSEVLGGLSQSKDPSEGLWDFWGRRYPVHPSNHGDYDTGLWLTRFQGQTTKWMKLPQ